MAIVIYLAQKYDASKSFYPDDLKIQAIIHQRHLFDRNSLFMIFKDIFADLCWEGKESVSQMRIDRIIQVMTFLEEYVKKTGFVAGTEKPSTADIAAFSSYASLMMTGNKLINFNDFPLAKKWAQNIKELIPNIGKSNQEGIDATKQHFRENSAIDWDK